MKKIEKIINDTYEDWNVVKLVNPEHIKVFSDSILSLIKLSFESYEYKATKEMWLSKFMDDEYITERINKL